MSANPLTHNPIDDAELSGFTGEIHQTFRDANDDVCFDLSMFFKGGELTNDCTIERYQVERKLVFSGPGSSWHRRNVETEVGDHVAALIKLLISGPELEKLAQKHELMVHEQGLGPDFDLRETWG